MSKCWECGKRTWLGKRLCQSCKDNIARLLGFMELDEAFKAAKGKNVKKAYNIISRFPDGQETLCGPFKSEADARKLLYSKDMQWLIRQFETMTRIEPIMVSLWKWMWL